MKIFISYRTDDSGYLMERLSEKLREATRDEVVVFTEDPVPLGEPHRDFIARLIAQSDCLLVVIGKHWLDAADRYGNHKLNVPDDDVRLEIEAGLADEGTRVIPVLVDLDAMPSPEELPASIRPLAGLTAQLLSLRHIEDDIAKLCQRIMGRHYGAKEVRIPLIPPKALPVGDGHRYGLLVVSEGRDGDGGWTARGDMVPFSPSPSDGELEVKVRYHERLGLQFKCCVDLADDPPDLHHAIGALEEAGFLDPTPAEVTPNRVWFLLADRRYTTCKSGAFTNNFIPYSPTF